LSIRSQYFNAVCDGRFTVLPPLFSTSHFTDSSKETEKRSITLPESEQTISTLLQQIYEVYNPTTGSIFTSFALRRALEKDHIITNLLALFIAADKYNLESIKLKAAEAIIDRLPFIHDPLRIVDLASSIYEEDMPPTDRGLKKAIIGQLQIRLESIMEDDDAWDEYSGNRVLVKAVHKNQVEMLEEGKASGLVTPPASPTKKRKFDGSE
jgi:histone acetyltransferase HTATIP